METKVEYHLHQPVGWHTLGFGPYIIQSHQRKFGMVFISYLVSWCVNVFAFSLYQEKQLLPFTQLPIQLMNP